VKNKKHKPNKAYNIDTVSEKKTYPHAYNKKELAEAITAAEEKNANKPPPDCKYCKDTGWDKYGDRCICIRKWDWGQ
jgi:hypothetical protein